MRELNKKGSYSLDPGFGAMRTFSGMCFADLKSTCGAGQLKILSRLNDFRIEGCGSAEEE
jgi:hypothetical protein